ncbi:hypothetical protein WR25_09032 [Diploscapter pachys]|uniref:Large ribosomal subunit protein mL49 n=1 Tax=Diploscapter pachys TaxID=2018661 RepID=A0A2A2M1D3_9BILA|nr:hypothetical protein WR25_09032 [Diploscapter pachys]
MCVKYQHPISDRSRSPERKFVINRAPGPNSGYHWLYDLPDDAQFDRGEERDVLRQDSIIKCTTSLPRLATSTPKMGYNGRGRGVGLSDTPKSISAPKFSTNNPSRVYEDGCVRKSAWYVESDGVLKEKHGWTPATPTSFLQHTFSSAPSPIVPEGTPKGIIIGSDSTEFDPDPSRGRSKSRSRRSHHTLPASPKEENRLPKPEELSNRPDGSALIKWLAHARNNPADTAARPRELLIPAEAVREGDLVTAVPDRVFFPQVELAKKTICVVNWSKDYAMAIRVILPDHGPYFVGPKAHREFDKAYHLYHVLWPRSGVYLDLYKREDKHGLIAGRRDNVKYITIHYIAVVHECTDPERAFKERCFPISTGTTHIFLNRRFLNNKREFDQLTEANYGEPVSDFDLLAEVDRDKMEQKMFRLTTRLSHFGRVSRIRSSQIATASTSAETPAEMKTKSTETDGKPWENPWKHALPEKTSTFTSFKELPVNWSEVERLFPIEIVPEVPHHDSFPTPSGWRPAANPPPDLPYYVRRRADHTLPLYLQTKKDKLNEKTLDIDHVEMVVIKKVEGDLFAFESDLRKYLEAKLGRPIATHIDELKGRVIVREVDRAEIERFLFDSGF